MEFKIPRNYMLMCRSTAVLQPCVVPRLYHYQRSVAFRLSYCLCLLPCRMCHSDVIIIFLKLECRQSEILVRLIRDTDTDIHHNDAHRHVLFFSCTHGALNCKLSVLELYLFFFSCFASSCLPLRTFFFVYFCLFAKKFLSNIPDVSAKGLSFSSLSFAFAFRCFRPYRNHPLTIDSMSTTTATQWLYCP